ncbi:MAG: threonine aldolase [Chitinophagales bacterium]|nr:MAG: threonine aldolase [Chitinophagales bacterium]
MASERPIDLRSDTVTRPTPGMLQAMMCAEVGDDVFGEDPSVNRLEEKAALLFGKEAALFCPSGTMTNQIAIHILTGPFCEVICDKLSHIYLYESAGMAFHSRASVRPLEGIRGRLCASDIEANIHPDDIHLPISKVVALENTCNKGGGSCYDFAEIKKIHSVCKTHHLYLHLDGARLFNALAETGESPRDYGALFDTISICLSKGLGAPAGSLLISSSENIQKARRVRKVMGGGMRQAGYLAAAGIYALDHHVPRLKEDHKRARALGETLQSASFVSELYPVETNIVLFTLNDKYDDHSFLKKLQEENILAVAMAPRMMRMVTHLDFNDDMLEKTIRVLKSL